MGLTNCLLIPGSPDRPFTTNTLADPAKAVTVLEQVAQKQQYGSYGGSLG